MNSNRVEYLVVGALAVSWHGFPRYSADIDFWVRPSLVNAELVVKTIHDFGMGSLNLAIEDFLVADRVIQLGHEPNRIDLLTSITGVEFEEAWQTRVSGTLDGLVVEFIGRDALLRNKDATGRTKDRIDAEELRNLDPFR